MKSVLFVCLGNICRSPMAEMIMKDYLNKNHLTEIKVESAATSTNEIGNSPHPGAIAELNRRNVPIINHHARQITPQDFEEFDYILGMDKQNIRTLNKFAKNEEQMLKIHLVTSFLEQPFEIEDPWYDENFSRTFNELNEAIPVFVNKNLIF